MGCTLEKENLHGSLLLWQTERPKPCIWRQISGRKANLRADSVGNALSLCAPSRYSSSAAAWFPTGLKVRCVLARCQLFTWCWCQVITSRRTVTNWWKSWDIWLLIEGLKCRCQCQWWMLNICFCPIKFEAFRYYFWIHLSPLMKRHFLVKTKIIWNPAF